MWLDMLGFCLHNSYGTLFTMYYESMYECSSPDASAHLVLFWTVFAQMRLIIVYVITPLRGIFPVQGCNNEFISG